MVLGCAAVEVCVPAGLACRADRSVRQRAGQWFDKPDLRRQVCRPADGRSPVTPVMPSFLVMAILRA